MWQIHVLVDDYNVSVLDRKPNKIWKPLRPSGQNKPYEWETREEAHAMARICYGGISNTVKIVEVKK